MGIKDPAVDQLIELIVAAPDRESLVTRTRCLDRVLSWHQFIVPQFYSGKELVAYWNRFARPEKTAKYSRAPPTPGGSTRPRTGAEARRQRGEREASSS